jgi:hypothetical protein
VVKSYHVNMLWKEGRRQGRKLAFQKVIQDRREAGVGVSGLGEGMAGMYDRNGNCLMYDGSDLYNSFGLGRARELCMSNVRRHMVMKNRCHDA